MKYHTLSGPSEATYKEKGSKFLAFAFPVSSQDEIREHLALLKKQYVDARHHCYAWVLGTSDTTYRANDDGEPNHSAGDPILGQIRSFGLTNTLVVVVRYFGGTKLGVGGLISAYKKATEQALETASIIEIHDTKVLSLYFGYDILSAVERLITDFEIVVDLRDFQSECKIQGKIKSEDLKRFEQSIKDLFTLHYVIEDE